MRKESRAEQAAEAAGRAAAELAKDANQSRQVLASIAAGAAQQHAAAACSSG